MTTADLQQLKRKLAPSITMTWTRRHVIFGTGGGAIMVELDSPRLQTIRDAVESSRLITAFLQPDHSGS
jgi:hypothetical protein